MRTALLRLLLGAAAGVALLAGCGGGDVSPNAGEVRLVNATSEFGTLDLYESSDRLRADVASFTASGYEDIDKGVYDFSIRGGVAGATLATLQATVKKNEPLTLVAYSNAGTPALAAIDEVEEEPDDDEAKLRFFNTAAGESGAIDAFLVASTDSCSNLGTAVAVASAVSDLQSTFITIDPSGTTPYRLCVTAAGDRTDVRLDADLVVDEREILTVVLTRTASGVLLDAVVVVQEDPVRQVSNTSARVRLAVGVGTGTVTASFDTASTSTSLGMNVPTGVLGSYVLVPTGRSLSVLWTGGTVTLPSTTIAGGGDHTLLVTTDTPGATTAIASLLTDDNARSTNTAKPVKVRLVHGATRTNPIGLVVGSDFIGGVAHGEGSSYVLTEPSASGTTTKVEVGDGSTILCSGLTTLTTATVYSVFALGNLPGAALAPCVVRAER